MSIFQEYDNSLQRSCDILFRQFEIDVSRIDNELTLESTIESIESELFCEAETLDINSISKPEKQKTQSKFSKTMSNIAQKVSKLINDIIEMFSNMFSSKSHLDVEAYINSSKGTIELDNDLKRVQAQVNAEFRKGRKLIQAISKGTGVDDETIEHYVDSTTDGVRKYGKTIISAAGSYALFKHATGDLESLKKEMNSALNDCKTAAGDPRKEMQVSKVYTAMRHWIAEGTKAYAMVGNRINEEALRQQKIQDKQNKKKK